MRERIVGRAAECARLDRCMGESRAQLVIVYGRRRVGKTFLVNEYFDNHFSFTLTGAYNQPKEVQLRNFAAELSRKTGGKREVPGDWIDAFERLRAYLEGSTSDGKRVVFFDEMPWLDTRKAGFMPAFEWFWNSWASTQDDLICIVCGSATSWMIDNIADNKGGLFNRQTCKLYLEPFTLHEVEEYLASRDISWSRYDIAECYMIMGGIPYYLSLLSGRLSYRQNIDALFFAVRGELWDEFDHLYRSLFTNSESYIKIVEALSKKSSGLTRGELSAKAGMPANGALSKMLKDLVSSGFVRVAGFYGHKKKDARYQLSDYFTAFYFRYMKDGYGKDTHYWSNTIDNPARRAWAGLAFEQLCRDHVAQIKHKLGISGVLSEESTWYAQADVELGTPGAQVDLLIDRRDGVINLCEMKFSLNEFVVDKAYEVSLRNKVEAFRRATDCRKSLQVTMVTTYGVKQNKYSSVVQSQIVLDDLFHE